MRQTSHYGSLASPFKAHVHLGLPTGSNVFYSLQHGLNQVSTIVFTLLCTNRAKCRPDAPKREAFEYQGLITRQEVRNGWEVKGQNPG